MLSMIEFGTGLAHGNVDAAYICVQGIAYISFSGATTYGVVGVAKTIQPKASSSPQKRTKNWRGTVVGADGG